MIDVGVCAVVMCLDVPSFRFVLGVLLRLPRCLTVDSSLCSLPDDGFINHLCSLHEEVQRDNTSIRLGGAGVLRVPRCAGEPCVLELAPAALLGRWPSAVRPRCANDMLGEKWRDRVLEAFDAGDLDKLNQLAAVSVRNSPSAIDLSCGAGFLPQDAFTWKDCSGETRRLVALALENGKMTRARARRQRHHRCTH